MYVLHSMWDTEKFHIWSESSALPLAMPKTPAKRPLPHPFAMTGMELKRHLSGSFNLDGSEIDALILQLPSGKGGLAPLPSPWLLHEDYISQKAVGLIDCTITTLALKPGPALDLLLDADMPLEGMALSDSMLFWSKLALFSMELVAREQFMPVVRDERSLWVAVMDGADQERLRILSSSMPPSCLASRSLQAASLSAASLVKSFLDSAVDSQVRKSLKQTTLLPSRRGRKPRSLPLPQQFLKALTAEDPALSASKRKLRPSPNRWTPGPQDFVPEQLMRHFAHVSGLRPPLNRMNPGG